MVLNLQNVLQLLLFSDWQLVLVNAISRCLVGLAKMVYETRKVVEDYVLFKIKEHITANQGGSNIEVGVSGGANTQTYARFPQPQEPPGKINNAVRLVARDFEEMYRRQYPDLLEKIRALHIATWDVDKVFTKVTSDVFKITYKRSSGASAAGPASSSRKSRTPSPALQEPEKAEQNFAIDDTNVKWGHVIALLVFTGVLAVRCVEINNNQQVDEIVNWVTKFFDTKLNGWLERHGGWDGFVCWYEESNGHTARNWVEQHHVRSRIANALRISGAVAAVALGAIVLTRK